MKKAKPEECSRRSRSILPTLSLVILIQIFGGCDSETSSYGLPSTNRIEPSKCEISYSTLSPSFSELTVKAERISSKEFLISLVNISQGNVYLAFTPGESDNARDFAYGIEKKNDNGIFEAIISDNDSVPMYNVILAKNQVKLLFRGNKKGVYRLVFRYLVDKNIVEILNNPECRFSSSSDTKSLIAQAKAEVKTPLLKF